MNKDILRLAIPNILSNLTVPLLSSVDTALMGHLENISYLGAIAIGGMIFNFVYWAFGFLRMGTTGLTAQSFGKEDRGESVAILLRALILALTLGILLFALKSLILSVSFTLINAPAQVKQYASEYFNIRIFAAPATLSLYVLAGWFLGMQNARYPLYLAVFTNTMNIFFNLLFIKEFDMHVDGVALGTVCANYAGVVLAIFLWYKRYRTLTECVDWNRIFDFGLLRKFFKINRDLFLRTLMLIFAFAFFTAKSSEAGAEILAANSILINLWTVMSYAIDGFAFAAESLVGRFLGSKNIHRLRRAIRYSFYWGLALAAATSLTFALFTSPILEIFTDKQEIIQLAQKYVIWTIFAPLISCVSYILDGIFIGATEGTAMRNAMMLSLFLVYLPLFFILKSQLHNHALWLALSAFMIARSVFLGIYFKRIIIKTV